MPSLSEEKNLREGVTGLPGVWGTGKLFCYRTQGVHRWGGGGSIQEGDVLVTR